MLILVQALGCGQSNPSQQHNLHPRETDPNAEVLLLLKEMNREAPKKENPALPLQNAQGKPQGGVETILEGHTRAITALAISNDCKFLASSSLDGKVLLWDLSLTTPKILATLKASSSGVAFSPDGKILATGTRETGLALWDLGKSPPQKKCIYTVTSAGPLP